MVSRPARLSRFHSSKVEKTLKAALCLQENMWAFCVETQDRTMVFAALRDDCADWVDKLCQSTFQV